MSKTILEMQHITKTFPGVKALDDVNLVVEETEIHALCGENGAGKSTLMNILSGVYPYGSYTGEIIFDGEVCRFKGIKESEAKGIAIIHQELALIPYLSVAENVFLSNEIEHNGVINWGETYKRAGELLKRVGYTGSIYTLVKDISPGQQQLVEIAKALSKNVRLLILDEPTSSLNETDAQRLLDLLVKLKAEGMTSIIISHKLNELEQISDKITILRDGRTIETLDRRTDELSEERIIRGMAGREILDVYPARNVTLGPTMFEIRNWSVCNGDAEKKVLDNISLHVRKGEVIGLAGLMGAGRTELALSLYAGSYGTSFSGEILKEDKPVRYKRVSEAIDDGLAYATEDRKAAGLVLGESVCDNIVLSSLKKLSNRGVRNRSLEIREAQAKAKELNVKCPTIYQKTVNLSGGNQQKVVLARWILTAPDVLILDEPTRGIDVGAKREIYSIINELAAQGKAVIFISSEMAELLGMCDRIYVMNEGKIVGELDRPQFSQEAVMSCIMKSSSKEGATK